MNNERKNLIAQYDRALNRLHVATVDVVAQQKRVEILQEQQVRPGFLKKPTSKVERHIRRLAKERQELRNRTSSIGDLHAEVERLSSRLAE